MMHLRPWQTQRVNALCKNTVREVERREEEEGGCNIPQKPLKLALKTTLE